ncbi:hypothetical protein Bca4012_036531 [Brassica carinata]
MTTAVEMASHSQVLVEDKSIVRTLTLNRPKQMNALCLNMITRLLQLFLAFEEDPRVKLVILKGQGKAFCAGGDVRPVIRDIVQGGAGISIHGRFRIATEKTVFAMPETELGLFPDVGASYFLSRLPGFFGEYVGLTGARLDGAEMLACGLATHFVPSTRLNALEADLCRLGSSDPVTFSSTILNAYTQHPLLKQHSAYHRHDSRLDVIDRCISRRTVEDIISTLEREAIQEPDEWILATIRALKKASPASLKITLRSIREGRFQGVGQCLIREYRMVCHVMKGELSKDLVEVLSAFLIVYLRSETVFIVEWEPRRLEQVTDNMVDQYFKRMDEEEGWKDLKLPPRINLPSSIMSKL